MSRTQSLQYNWAALCDLPSAELEGGLELLLNGKSPELSRNTLVVMKQLFCGAMKYLDSRSKTDYQYTNDDCDAYCFLARSLKFGEFEKYPRSDVIAADKKIENEIRSVSSLVERLPEVDSSKRDEYVFLKEILGKIKQYSYNSEHMRRFAQ